jgi:hypothetical protein
MVRGFATSPDPVISPYEFPLMPPIPSARAAARIG